MSAQARAEVIGRKGCSVATAEHAMLMRLLYRWLAAFSQQQVSWRGQPVIPFMEIGITAPKYMTPEEVLGHSLSLCGRLMLQGVSRRFYLRSVEHMNPATSPTYRALENDYLDQAVKIIRETSELATTENLQGPVIGKEEFDLEWTAGEYYYGSAHCATVNEDCDTVKLLRSDQILAHLGLLTTRKSYTEELMMEAWKTQWWT
jgi:hypothetical protein